MRNISRRLLPYILVPAFTGAALGQEFEAVSVKPNKSGAADSHSRSDQGLLTGTNLSLRSLILTAYGVKDYQVEGPDWLGSARFDISAKFPEALPRDREKYSAAVSTMMRKMLEGRFQLMVHHEQKMFTVYGLIAGRIKFKEVQEGPSRSDSDNHHYEGVAITMARFAEFLSRRTDLPVLDMTGLKGFYNLTLDWAPEPKPGEDPGLAGASLRDAVQEQLGLKLETRKAPVDVVVVDHAEPVPTDN